MPAASAPCEAFRRPPEAQRSTRDATARRRRLVIAVAWPLAAAATSSTPPLVAAAEAGDLATLRRLLDAGAPIEARDARGRTALMAATHADLKSTSRSGSTPLIGASHRGHPDNVRELLRAGARR